MSLWHQYWAWVGGNVGAMPLQALITGVPAWLLRHHIGRYLAAWWDRHHGPHAVRRHRQAMKEHEAERSAGD